MTERLTVWRHVLEDVCRRVRDEYSAAIRRCPAELPTPALLVDVAAAERNVVRLASLLADSQTALRPHFKAHKCVELADLQVRHGALGPCVATVWEAATLIAAGFDDILVANTVVAAPQLDVIAELARDRRLIVAIDDVVGAHRLAEVARLAQCTVGVLIDVDVGMRRAGVASAEEAIALASQVAAFDQLVMRGVMGYEGHCALVADEELRRREHAIAMQQLVDVADELDRRGIGGPIRSAGGTATCAWAAARGGITEVQAGSYVLMDRFHAAFTPTFESAMTIVATVVSRRDDRVVIDAGSKSIADAELSSVVGGDSLKVLRFDEEHGIFTAAAGQPRLGEVIEIVPGYGPATVNLFDAIHVVESDTVVDIWPIVPRGPGHHGLISAPRGAAVDVDHR